MFHNSKSFGLISNVIYVNWRPFFPKSWKHGSPKTIITRTYLVWSVADYVIATIYQTYLKNSSFSSFSIKIACYNTNNQQ